MAGEAMVLYGPVPSSGNQPTVPASEAKVTVQPTRRSTDKTRGSLSAVCMLIPYGAQCLAVLILLSTRACLGLLSLASLGLWGALGCRRCPPPDANLSVRVTLPQQDPVAWHAQIYLPGHAQRVTAFSTQGVPKSVACRLPWIAMSRTRSAKDLRIQPPTSSRSGGRNSTQSTASGPNTLRTPYSLIYQLHTLQVTGCRNEYLRPANLLRC